MKTLPGKVLVELKNVESQVTKGGLYLPETAQTGQVVTGIVVATGEIREDTSKIVPMSIKVGMTVWFVKHSAFELTYDGKRLFSMPESNILAFVTES